MDWLTFLKDVIATQQFLQIFVGGWSYAGF